MKGKPAYSILFLLVAAFCLLGCGGGSSSNPAAPNGTANARVSGVVLDSRGEPVVNAAVRLVLANRVLVDSLISSDSDVSGSLRLSAAKRASDNNMIATEFLGLTDSFGAYEFNAVPHGLYTFSANTADGAQVVANFSVRGSEAKVPEVILKPTGTLSGIVKKSDIPVAAAIVYLDGTSYCTFTSVDGSYSLSGVPVETDFKLAVTSTEGSFAPVSIRIPGSGRAMTKDISLAPINEKSFSVAFNVQTAIEALRSELPQCFFLVISNESSGYVAVVNEQGKATLKIAKAGDYTIIPAYRGNRIANAGFSGGVNNITVSETDIQTEQIKSLTFDLSGALTQLSAVLKGVIEADSGVFEVDLYGKSGIRRTKTLAAKSSFIFSNLPDDEYAIVVSSNNALYIKKGVVLASGEVKDIGNLAPVSIAPKFTPKSGCIDFKLNNTPVAAGTSGVSYKVGLRQYNDDPKNERVLVKIDGETLTESFDAASLAPVTLSTDGCNDGEGNLWITFSFSIGNSSDKMAFEKSYLIAPEALTVKFKTVKLGELKASDDIIYFKTVQIGNSYYYLVATPLNVYLFDSNGALVESWAFQDEVGAGTVIKLGNLCVGENSSGDIKLFVQYLRSGAALGILAIDVNSSGFTNPVKYNNTDNFALTDYGTGSNFEVVYSPNKLEFVNYSDTLGWQLISLCDNCIRKISLQITGSTVSVSDKKIRFLNNSSIYTPLPHTFLLASHSTFINLSPGKPNEYRFYYIACGDNNDNYKSYIGTIGLDSELNPDPEEKLTALAFESFGDNGLVTVNRDSDSGCYSYKIYTQVNPAGTPFPFAIAADKDDDAEAEAIVLSGSYCANFNAEKALEETRFVQTSSSIFPTKYLSSSGIKDSFAEAIYFIERNSSGQYIRVKSAKTMELLQKIKVNQVVNRSTFLEGSIGYTKNNSSSKLSKVHCLTMADGDNAIQVVVFDNIASLGN